MKRNGIVLGDKGGKILSYGGRGLGKEVESTFRGNGCRDGERRLAKFQRIRVENRNYSSQNRKTLFYVKFQVIFNLKKCPEIIAKLK